MFSFSSCAGANLQINCVWSLLINIKHKDVPDAAFRKLQCELHIVSEGVFDQNQLSTPLQVCVWYVCVQRDILQHMGRMGWVPRTLLLQPFLAVRVQANKK